MTLGQDVAPRTTLPTTTEELLQRACEISASLVDRQAETEARTYYAEDTHAAFAEAGFYRLLTPKRYGGYELPIEDYLAIARTIARGCPSTGWCFTLGTSHALTAASFFPEETQDAIFADTDLRIPLTFKPQGSARRTAGGWEIHGEFNFCSGIPYATYFIGHVLADIDGKVVPSMFVAPRELWTRLDDWGNQIGLKGSGSHSIRFDGGVIPESWLMPSAVILGLDPQGGTPGLTLHGNPAYAGWSTSFFLLETASLAVGMAQGALDAYEVLLRTKNIATPPFNPRSEDPNYQRWFGDAMGKVATAEAAVLHAAGQWMKYAASGHFTPERDLSLVTIAREVIRLSWDAVHGVLVRSAGSTSMRTGERIERIFRDLATVHSHNGIVSFGELATQGVAQLHLAEATP